MAFPKTPEIDEGFATCTFCLKDSNHVGVMIASAHPPRAYICGECVDICNHLLCQKQMGTKFALLIELDEAYRRLRSRNRELQDLILNSQCK